MPAKPTVTKKAVPNVVLDATGKSIGRVASEAAQHILGKKSVSFAKNKIENVKVSIVNCSKAYIPEKKRLGKEYVTFTGFRGGINTENLGHLIGRKGAGEAFKRAVYRMIPRNSLRKNRIMNLTVTE